MITLIQSLLQKHYKWLLTVLLGVIIVSFVFTYSASSGFGSASQSNQSLDFYGFNLNLKEDQKHLFEGANLSYYIQNGRVFSHELQMQQAGLARGIFLHIANTLNIPEPTEEQLVEFIQKQPLFLNEKGQFDSSSYNNFQSILSSNVDFGIAFGKEVLTDDYRIQKVQESLKGPGFTQSFELLNQIHRLETLWSVHTLNVDLDSFRPSIKPSPEDLKSFYSINPQSYQKPAHIHISYIYFTPPLNANKEASELEAQANDFVYNIYESNIRYGSKEFNDLLSKYKLTLKSLPSFPIGNNPSTSPVPSSLIEEIYNLDEQNYYTSPLAWANGFYVLFLEDVTPPIPQSFDESKKEVEASYIVSKKKELFSKHIESLQSEMGSIHTLIEFENKAKSLKLITKNYLSFTIPNTPPVLGLEAMAHIQNMKPGHVSPPLYTEKGCTFIYVSERSIPQSKPTESQLELAQNQINSLITFSRIQSLFSQLINEGLPSQD